MLVLTAPVWPAAPPPWQQAGPAAQLTAPAGQRAARAVQQAPPPPSSSPFPHLGDSSLPSSDALDTKKPNFFRCYRHELLHTKAAE